MLLATAECSRKIDETTIKSNKIPGIILMENAGAALAKEAFCGADKIYTAVAGGGNNGGDGSVAARHLAAMGADAVLCLVCPYEKLSGDAKAAYDMAVSFGVTVICGICDDFYKRINNSDVIIDALLGTGCNFAPHGDIKTAICAINDASAKIFSADVPSGINCDTGAVCGDAVAADKTVTFGVAKAGLFIYPARKYAGEVTIANIGFSPDAVKAQNIKTQTIDSYGFPKINPDDHKGSRGKVIVAAGSEKYSGAAFMSAYAALKSGSGLVTLITPGQASMHNAPELVYDSAPCNDGHFDKSAGEKILSVAKNADVIITGCGTGTSDGAFSTLKTIVENSVCPVVIDADGINMLAQNKDILKHKNCDIIITPHIAEMARFVGTSPDKVSENMIEIAKTAAAEYNIVVILKSATTVIADQNGNVYVNTMGSGGMATAGSGDVLSGITGGFIAQGMSPIDAAVNAVAVHAVAGSEAALKKGEHYMTATDIIEGLSTVELKGRDKL